MKHKPKGTAQQIITQAKTADGSTDAYLRLLQLISTNLERGDDATLERALRDAGSRDLAEAISDAIRDCSQSVLISRESPWGTKGYQDFDLALFAVPLVILNSTGRELPESVSVSKLSKSFRKHGLITKNPSVYLYGALASLEDLQMPHSQRYALAKRVANNPYELPFAPKKVRERTHLHLRFLLGAVISNLDDPLPFEPADGEDEEHYEARLDAWENEAEMTLEAALPGLLISTPGPATLAEALEGGVNALQLEDLALMTSYAHDVAVLSFHGDGEVSELRLGFFEGTSLRGGFVWKLQAHQFLPEVIELIEGVFEELGSELHFVEGLHSLGACPDCGEPLFFSPAGEAVHARAKRILN
ncbi:MAG: DUF2863 family protein [Deinococcota bacterium]|nr:DUF2863 family protein [Deinococcota bacterium]